MSDYKETQDYMHPEVHPAIDYVAARLEPGDMKSRMRELEQRVKREGERLKELEERRAASYQVPPTPL